MTLDPWRCDGSRFVNMRTGTQGPLLPAAVTYTPKGAVQGGLVTVDPGLLANYDQYGPSSYVYKIAWNTVEPSQGNYSWTAIDNLLTSMGTATMTLRIQAGGSAPEWLKDQLGRLTITNNQLGLSTVITHFWEAPALAAWDAMIRAAGARYDDDPRVVLVSSDEAMTLYSEPLILGGHDASAIAMYNAGLNKDTHRNAMLVSTQSCVEAFPGTLVEFAGHGDWQQATATGVVYSWPDARTLLNELCLAHKDHLVITDYGLDSTDFAANFPLTGTMSTASNYYRWMRIRKATATSQGGGRIGFQLTLGAGETHTGQERADGAQNAYDFGADFVEHSSWGTIVTEATGGATELTRLDTQLKTQAGY